MILDRSTKGKHAKAVFFHDFNDIDIYIEDTALGSKKLYREIFSRIFDGKYRVDTVFPLGCKQTVVQQCTEDQENGGRARIYITDGDLELLIDNNPQGLKRFYVLKRYCIENYLIDESSIISILHEEDLEKSLEDIEHELDFQQWVKENEEELFNLFVTYAIAKCVLPELPTITFPVNKLVSSPKGVIDVDKIANRKKAIKDELLNHNSDEELIKQKEAIINKVEACAGKKLNFVSGKHYLLPLILMRMKAITKFRAENRVIKQRLAMKCDITELMDVAECLAAV